MHKLIVNLATALAITTVFALVVSAHAGNRVAMGAPAQLGTLYTVTADPYLPIQEIEPAY